MSTLNNKTIAIVATDGFEYAELAEPKKALEQAGAKTNIISPKDGEIRAWDKDHWKDAGNMNVDKNVARAKPQDYDGLLLPGGVINPDKLRLSEETIEFIKAFVVANKPIAAICHGPWTLIDAGAVKGRQMTSWPSLQADLENAGAQWVDREVVHDGNLVTSRKPDDIPAFNEEVIKLYEEVRVFI